MSNSQDPRIAELNELARREGITLPLPLPADVIARLEDAGHIVDLSRCVVSLNEADRPISGVIVALLVKGA